MSQSFIMYPYCNIIMDSQIVCPPAVEKSFGEGQHAFERSQFPEAILKFNNALAAIDCHLRAVVLLGRAMCQEMEGNLTLAFTDAKKVVRLSPTWTGGYMYLGRLYSIQCDYAQVFLTLQTGVAKSNKDDPRYEELVYQYHSMESRIRRRNCSILDRLPVESLYNVFSYLDFEGRIQSASTCRYWRRFMLERFPVMWLNIDLQKSHWILENIPFYHSVRTVRISCSDAEEALQVLIRKNIRGILVLELYNCHFEASTLFQMLYLIRYSLQTLVLSSTNITPNILLGTVFDTVPSLLHFTCTERLIESPSYPEVQLDCLEDLMPQPDHYHDDTYHSQGHQTNNQKTADDSSQRSTTALSLPLRQLHVGRNAAPNLISRVISRSPKLQSLILYEVDYDTLSHCKNLQSLNKLCLYLAGHIVTIKETQQYDMRKSVRSFISKAVAQLRHLELSGTFIDEYLLSTIANNGFLLQNIRLSDTCLLPEEILRFSLQLREAQRFSLEPLQKLEIGDIYGMEADNLAMLRDELKLACHIQLITANRTDDVQRSRFILDQAMPKKKP